MRVIGRNPMSVIVRVFGLKADMVRLPRRATCGLMHRNKRTHAPQQAVSLTRLSRLITICQRAAKAIPLISGTDRAETSGTDRADCDGTRFAGPPF
jgi:hypothetical protein